MGNGKNWYGLGVVLLIVSLVHMTFFNYVNHAGYATLEAIWGAICFLLGFRAEWKGR
ncbi:MAG: hypothetical protein HY304_00440 [candidate division Zixibacteria bacterium]|nr:hypothetical protein [candidate division Zixibacteria bacterium]